jgi:hypothetical protein
MCARLAEADPPAFKLKSNGATVNSPGTSSDEGALQTPMEPAGRMQQQTLRILAGGLSDTRSMARSFCDDGA